MELINQIFYYFVLFVPILFWLAYRFGYREHIDKISDVIMKKMDGVIFPKQVQVPVQELKLTQEHWATQ